MADRKPTAAPRSGSTAVTPAKVASPSAKEAKALAKAARTEAKLRRKNSTDPAEMGRLRQIQQAYKVTREFDPRLPLLLAGAFLLPVVVGLVIGLLVGHVVYAVVMGVLLGVLLAMALLVRRAKGATYKRYAGQTGSAEVALSMLPKQWIVRRTSCTAPSAPVAWS
jgi:Flp pilus assembly protein TadB